jgi:hypothetical protein
MSSAPLSSADLLDTARAATGLSDFGELPFREGLDRLVDAINRESALSAFGEAAVPAMLVGRLINRLQIEDWYHRHPEIEDEVIRDPVFIVGLPRTGSTALGHMLALDPDTRSLRSWEAAQPCPPPRAAEALTDPRIAENAAREAAFEEMAPGVREALPRNSSAPTECFAVLDLSMACLAQDGFLHVPSFIEWLRDDAPDELAGSYLYHRRVLKLLQWRHPARRWQLRTPVHAYAMDALLAAYPDARFIMTHRDPAKAVPSVCLLMHHVRSVFLADPLPRLMGPAMVEGWSLAMERLLDFRDRIGQARFHDVAHRDQLADPVGTVAAVYAALGWPFGEAAAQRIADWREDNPKGSHRPDPDFFGIDQDRLRDRFSAYTDRFAALLGKQPA